MEFAFFTLSAKCKMEVVLESNTQIFFGGNLVEVVVVYPLP